MGEHKRPHEPMALSSTAEIQQERLAEAVRLIDATPVRWPRGEWRLESWDDGDQEPGMQGFIMACRDEDGILLAAMNPDDFHELRAKLKAEGR